MIEVLIKYEEGKGENVITRCPKIYFRKKCKSARLVSVSSTDSILRIIDFSGNELSTNIFETKFLERKLNTYKTLLFNQENPELKKNKGKYILKLETGIFEVSVNGNYRIRLSKDLMSLQVIKIKEIVLDMPLKLSCFIGYDFFIKELEFSIKKISL